MKKRSILSRTLALMMVLTLTTGCGNKNEDGGGDAASEPLRVAVQSFYCSSMAQYIQDQGLAEQAGLDIEWIVFNGGAAINEAMGEWDVSVTGGAFVYALANYGCKLVAHQVNGIQMATTSAPAMETR